MLEKGETISGNTLEKGKRDISGDEPEEECDDSETKADKAFWEFILSQDDNGDTVTEEESLQITVKCDPPVIWENTNGDSQPTTGDAAGTHDRTYSPGTPVGEPENMGHHDGPVLTRPEGLREDERPRTDEAAPDQESRHNIMQRESSDR